MPDNADMKDGVWKSLLLNRKTLLLVGTHDIVPVQKRDIVLVLSQYAVIVQDKDIVLAYKNNTLFLDDLLRMTVECHTMTCDDDDMRYGRGRCQC